MKCISEDNIDLMVVNLSQGYILDKSLIKKSRNN